VLNVLQSILCYVSEIPALILIGCIGLVNALLYSIGLVITAAAYLLPDMPTASTSFMPNSVLQTANWFFPIGAVVDGLGIVLALWISYLVVKIVLSWLKVLGV